MAAHARICSLGRAQRRCTHARRSGLFSLSSRDLCRLAVALAASCVIEALGGRSQRLAEWHGVPVSTGMARPLVRCYLKAMRVMARLLPLLFMAAVLTLPAIARTILRADVQIEASAAFVQSAAPSNAKRMAIMCRGCKVKACGANAITCITNCGAANTLLPLTIVLATITPQVAGPSVIPAFRDHHGPPDPSPPRPIAIS